MKRILLIWLLASSLFTCAQSSPTHLVGEVGGFSGSGTSQWNPAVVLNNATLNNSANCASGCAPESGSAAVTALPGLSETLFVATTVARGGSGTGTVTIASGQGCCGKAATYNFATTDSVIITGCGTLNGTYPITAITSPNITVTMAGASTSVSSCTAQRKNTYSTTQYIPPPAAMANYVDDGVDIHDLLYYPYSAGSGDSVIVMYHVVPFQHCPSSGACPYAAKPNQTTNGSHIMVGYKASNATQIAAQIAAMKRLSKPSAPSGAIYDWSGGPIPGQSSSMADEKGAFDTWTSQLASQSAFKFAVAIDNSGWAGPCGSVSSQSPTCVEQVIENSLIYAKTPTTSTFTSVKNPSPVNGGGMFTSSAYLQDPATGRPVVFMWFNGESNWFGSCTSGSPCAVYNNGTTGTTCTSSSDCWLKLKNGIASYISSWSTGVKPEFLWRNNFSTNTPTSMNNGSFSWQNPTSDGSNHGYEDSLITTASTSTKLFVASATPHLNHAQSSFQDDNFLIGDRCGQTWLDWMMRTSTAGAGHLFGPGGKALWVMEIATWNDHEEGTVLEPGVGNCYSISASIASGVVSWSLSSSDHTNAPVSPLVFATNNTIDHIALLAVRTGGGIGGKDTQVVATASPASSGTFNMSTIHIDSGSYTLYVKLIPRAGIQTKISTGLSFTK